MNHPALEETIVNLFQDRENLILAESILGTTDAAEISEEISEFCLKNLGTSVSDCLYAGLSVGASFGLALADGRKIFLKIHKPAPQHTITAISKPFLTAVANVQEHLAGSRFPCPRVILQPTELGRGIATVDEFAAPGVQKDAHDPAIRRSMAETLAELIQRTRPYKSLPGLTKGNFYADRSLYPIPHNALFDFERTARGAEWIDKIAERARNRIGNIKGEVVLGHVDWSVKHFRFEGNRTAIIYDWDSLKLEDELNILGIAAATFPTTWDIPVKITPSPDESFAFVREYEEARGKKFTTAEWKKAAAAAAFCMAYVARCEHALDPQSLNYKGSFREALAGIPEGLMLFWHQ